MQSNANYTVKKEVHIIDVDDFVMPIVDVDLHHAKYEYTEEDGIESIDSHAFRQSVRRSKESEKDAIKRQSFTPTLKTPDATSSHTRTISSTIGPVIQNAMAQKRQNSSSSLNQSAAGSSHVSKRRRLEGSPLPPVSSYPRPPSSEVLTTPISRSSKVFDAPSSSSVTIRSPQPSSPDILFVSPVAKGKAANLAVRSSVPSTSSLQSATIRPQRINANSSSMNRGGDTSFTRKRAHDVIELSSESEEDSDTVDLLPSAQKKLKPSIFFETAVQPRSEPDVVMSDTIVASEPESGDHDWDWDPPGFDLNDYSRWKPLATNENKFEDDVINDLENFHIDEPRLQPPSMLPRYIRPNTSWNYSRPVRKSIGPPKFIWDQLRSVLNLHFRPRPRQPFVAPTYFRPWHLDFKDLYKLNAASSFKEAPGSITKIEQKGCWTAIASACDGGLPDEPDERPSDYNRPGSLMTWCNGLDIPEGHRAKRNKYRDGYKHYAVNDVKFAPNRNCFVTSGADKQVRLWELSPSAGSGGDSDRDSAEEIQPGESQWRNSTLHRCIKPPHELAFKPESSVLAVAEKKALIFTLTDEGSQQRGEVSLHNSKEPHIIGSMAWGAGATSDHLFISSEPSNPDIHLSENFQGRHRVVDVHSGSESSTLPRLYDLDANEAGDTLALDSTGGVLALTTRAAMNRHILRLYDVNRQISVAHTAVDLEVFSFRYEGFEGEMTCASFSPDGIYLAIARNDNLLHVYDSRMLTRGPLFEYEHFGDSKAPSQTSTFGVVKAQWIQSDHTKRFALVTAGEDGCVRLWNPLVSSYDVENGISIAEVNSDISHFSLGDRFAGEHQLVVGDCVGEVTIFNNIII